MATALKNLSSYDPSSVPSGKGMRIGLIVAEWNSETTYAMRDGAINALLKHEVNEADIQLAYVPGTFELTSMAHTFAQTGKFDAIIVLGCVIKGETRHFDFICQSVTQGITTLNLQFSIPFIFGVLTTDTFQQATDRAGGKHGNKGDEAAITAIKMVAMAKSI